MLAQAFSFPERSPADSGLVQALTALARDLGVSHNGGLEISRDPARAEYTRLFVNAPSGVPAPPYASVYIAGARILMQQGLDQARAYYREAGLSPQGGVEPEDHISTELAFVGALLDAGREDLLEGFLRKHLLIWYPRFMERLLEAGPHPFYAVAARVTWQFLKSLCQEDLYEQTKVS